MRIKEWLAAAGLVVALQGVGYAQEEEGPNVSEKKGEIGTSVAVELAERAMNLVSYARENESPTAMITAMEMLGRVQLSDGSERLGEKKVEGKKSEKGNKDTPAPSVDVEELAAEARQWAEGDESMLELIDEKLEEIKVTSAGTLGAVGGPIRKRDLVLARTTDIYTIRFIGGRMARVAVIGDGDTDLDLIIEDQFGNTVDSDTDYTDRCVAVWTPRWTGVFKVKIVNLGGVYNEYVLITN